MIQSRTPQQKEIVSQLTKQFEIDSDRILFLNPRRPEEPWLPAEELLIIARKVGGFQSIGEQFDQFIPGLNQYVHIATVIDKDGRTYSRSGIATEGETLPNTEETFDPHDLAASRALGAALRAAGFYPFRAGSVIDLNLKLSRPSNPVEAEAESRNADLAAIHIEAEKKGLIVEGVGGRKDISGYKNWLFENWGVTSAGALNPVERQSAIAALKQMPNVDTVRA
ncbi:MAG TPA: hypothetical protein VE732_05235 [Nitrososphaera sp.]|jgi:hypothetical protein|nr:hypothetical protein [Nitrososphaera sp.]